MGTIYLAVAGGLADFHKLLVVKELRQDLSANQRFVEMFLDEAKLAARLNHPNVVQTIEAGQENDRYFLSMEFLDGQPFNAIWRDADKAPAVTLPIRLKILSDALAGLHYAHTLQEYDGTSLHIVHRDVSPQNIFVTYDGQVKVVDFGIAKAAVTSSSKTTPGMFKGKFGYAAPEQVRGQEDLDARTDVFAMGVILWETLSMRQFSHGQVTRSSITNRLNGLEPRAAEIPGVDKRLAAICDRALAVDPDARFSTADQFRVALDEYLAQTGQRVEISAIKEVMANKFAAERRAIHQLIDSHIKRGEITDSQVQATGLDAEVGNNQPTQIADLSKYIDNTAEVTVISGSIAVELSVPAPPPEKAPTRNVKVVGICAAIAAVLCLGFFKLSATTPEPRAIPLAPLPAPAQTSVATAPPVSQPVAAAPLAAAPTPTPQPTAAMPTTPETTVAPKAPTHDAPHAVARRGQRARAAAPNEVRTPAPQPVVAEPAPAPAVAAPARVEPAHAAPAPVTVGADLNRVEKSYQRRAIDTEL